MPVPLGQYKEASGVFEAILPVPARMASLLLLALVVSLATGQYWRSNMEEDFTGQYWPASNMKEEGKDQKREVEDGGTREV